MDFAKIIPIWMLIQVASPSADDPSAQGVRNKTIAYYFDKNTCELVAASDKFWNCQKRGDIEKRLEELKKQSR